MREMEVYIANKDLVKNRYYGITTLFLPATQDAIRDALYRAKIEDGSEYIVECCNGGWPELVEEIINEIDNISVQEVNLLAYQIGQMDEFQKETFEGTIQLRQEENIDEPVTIKELINLAHNLDSYEYRPGVVDDQTLGNVAMEHDLLDTIVNLPEEIMELLDAEKVGQEMRRYEMGTFTERGYIFPNGTPHQEFYDGVTLPTIPNMPNGVISVQVVSADRQNKDGVWLELPATEKKIQKVLSLLDEQSFDNCLIKGSISTAFPYPLAGDEEIAKLNLLAQKIQEFPNQKTLAKFKAIMELELCHDLDFALDITENMECYDYDPQMYSPAVYAEYLLKEAGFNTSDPAFTMFDFQGYGERQIKQLGYMQTAYGLIWRNEVPFVPKYSQTESMQLGGM